MSTFTETNNIKTTPLDGSNDLVEVKTSFVLAQEAAAAAAKKKAEESE
tara:strand:+ start:145 stop:288 length:144 start_codon:yes stop_codon:yes gene_type:complete